LAGYERDIFKEEKDMNKEFPVADLQNQFLEKVKKMENELREQTGEEIVLIAYKHNKQQI
jgi:hypothetical protein